MFFFWPIYIECYCESEKDRERRYAWERNHPMADSVFGPIQWHDRMAWVFNLWMCFMVGGTTFFVTTMFGLVKFPEWFL